MIKKKSKLLTLLLPVLVFLLAVLFNNTQTDILSRAYYNFKGFVPNTFAQATNTTNFPYDASGQSDWL